MSDPQQRLRKRLEEFQRTGDPAAITGPAADQDLRDATPSSANGLDTDVAHTLAWVRWSRSQVLAGGESEQERKKALPLFDLVHAEDPHNVPGPLQDLLAERGKSRLDRASVAARQTFRPYMDVQSSVRHAIAQYQGYLQDHDPGRLEDALDHFRRVMAEIPPGNLLRPIVALLTGLCLYMQYERTQSADVLREAVTTLREGVAGLPPRHELRPTALICLACVLQVSYMNRADAGLLTEIMSLAQEATEGAQSESPMRDLVEMAAAAMADLNPATAGSPEDSVDRLVAAARARLAGLRADDPARPEALAALGAALAERFNRTGDGPDLDEALSFVEAAGPDGGPLVWSVHGTLLAMRSRLGGDTTLSDRAMELLEKGVTATPPRHALYPIMRANLAVGRWQRYERTQDQADLEAAIGIGREVLETVDATSQLRPTLMHNLAAGLQDRYRYTQDRTALDESLELARSAQRSFVDRSREHLAALNSLVLGLILLHRHTGKAEHVHEAVELGRRLKQAMRAGDPHCAVYLMALAQALETQGEVTGSAADLDEAIDLIRDAADAPGERPAGYVETELASALLRRFEKTNEPGDLDEAADRLREASKADGEVRLSALALLGRVLRLRYERSRGNDQDSLNQAAEVLQRALAGEHGPTRFVTTAIELGRVRALLPDWVGAAAAFGAAIEKLPMMAPRTMGPADRTRVLERVSRLAADAAACAISAGLPERAVELLEQGRALQIAQLIDARADLTELRERAPELAARLTALRLRLDAIDRSGPPAGSVAERRHRAHDEWDRLVTEIRAVPGMGSFLMPMTAADIRAEAAAGAIVYLNVSVHRSDAIVVTADAIRTVWMPPGFDKKVTEQARRFEVARTTGDREAALDVLDWLRRQITAKVLAALGHRIGPEPGRPLPRVWWCAGGPLVTLPVHAAVLDRVVSSYIPSVRALRHARGGAPLTAAALDQMLVVPVASPRHIPLPAVKDEAGSLQALFPDATIMPAEQATVARVAEALRGHPVVHFACHAETDAAQPARSALHLFDGPLTVTRLGRIGVPDATLAYLSACETAGTSDPHAAEALHLASAFQAIGFRHVVASLWKVEDAAARELAGDVYRRLSGDGPADDVAVALHEAVLARRLADPDAVVGWATLIHTGA
jgi:tetratricopeptide (TPR) repeat protein